MTKTPVLYKRGLFGPLGQSIDLRNIKSFLGQAIGRNTPEQKVSTNRSPPTQNNTTTSMNRGARSLGLPYPPQRACTVPSRPLAVYAAHVQTRDLSQCWSGLLEIFRTSCDAAARQIIPWTFINKNVTHGDPATCFPLPLPRPAQTQQLYRTYSQMYSRAFRTLRNSLHEAPPDAPRTPPLLTWNTVPVYCARELQSTKRCGRILMPWPPCNYWVIPSSCIGGVIGGVGGIPFSQPPALEFFAGVRHRLSRGGGLFCGGHGVKAKGV